MIFKVRYISFDFHHKIKALMNIIFEWIGISIKRQELFLGLIGINIVQIKYN